MITSDVPFTPPTCGAVSGGVTLEFLHLPHVPIKVHFADEKYVGSGHENTLTHFVASDQSL